MAIVLCCCNASGQVNNWTKRQSGYWEEPFWSLGELPSATHSAIQFTNAGFKALAIGPGTRAQYPQTLTISNLIVSAPANSGNLLLLNYSGLQVPLRVLNGFELGPNGHLLTLYARLQVGGNEGGAFYISGPVMHGEFSEVTAGNVFLGYFAPGSYNLTNGLLSVNSMLVGTNVGTFNQYGGIHRFRTLGNLNYPFGAVAGSMGTYNLYAGQLEGGQLVLGSGLFSAESPFTFNQFGGSLTLTNGVWLSPGARFIQNSGTNVCYGIFLDDGRYLAGASPCYCLSNGTLITHRAHAETGGRGAPTFAQFDGTHVTDQLDLKGDPFGGSGRYHLVGGKLLASGIELKEWGSMIQEGGNNTVSGDLVLFGGASYSLSGGWLSTSNILFTSAFADSRFVQTGGICSVANKLELSQRCSFNLRGGVLLVSNLSIGLGAAFGHTGGVIMNHGTFTLDSAFFPTIGQPEPLGRLRISHSCPACADPNPTIVLASNACALKFADSHNEPWQLGISLEILGWKGSTNGGGYNQLVFGNSSAGLSRHQLAQIAFNDPAGFPPGRYPARILDTGEVVPTHQPLLAFNALSRNLVLSWLDGFILQTATNVTGPYVDVPAFGLYTNPLTADPQRFFRLRQ